MYTVQPSGSGQPCSTCGETESAKLNTSARNKLHILITILCLLIITNCKFSQTSCIYITRAAVVRLIIDMPMELHSGLQIIHFEHQTSCIRCGSKDITNDLEREVSPTPVHKNCIQIQTKKQNKN